MYRYYIGQGFKKMLKPYLKKHQSLLDDVIDSLRFFDKRLCASLGANLYKMRVAVSAHSKGKRASLRMVVYILEVEGVLAPIAFYSKHDRASMFKEELIHVAHSVMEEFTSDRLIFKQYGPRYKDK